jgi:SpoVK/Ycf46/Vps4 family AAA+-type ATPase
MSKYNLFVESNDKFIPFKIDGTHKELPSGAYTANTNYDTGQIEFHKLKMTCDDIIDLPSKEYDYVLNQIKHFLKPSTKEAYIREGFIYKRSVLLHGKPGTGKTVIVNRVAKEALKNNAVILFNPNPSELENYYKALDQTAPDKLTFVIFEEFDTYAKEFEDDLLSVLDGEVQKNNVIYLATTNYLEEVPMRMQRPGRFSSIVEVEFPDTLARTVYLKNKNIDEKLLNKWIDSTEGFSIDEIKETVLAVKCLGESLDTVVKRIKDLKDRGLESESKINEELNAHKQHMKNIHSLMGGSITLNRQGVRSR